MATLHVRNVPESLYEQLRLEAERQGRSLSAEVIVLLEEMLYNSGRDQAAILADIRRRRSFDTAAVGVPDSTATLRAMRDSSTLPYLAESEALPDEALIAEARQLGRHATDFDALTAALEEYITRQRQQAVLELFGTIEYDPDYDYKAQRRRS